MKSVFTEKTKTPTEAELQNALGNTSALWKTIAAFTKVQYPEAEEIWNFGGEKYGWSFRIKDKKRILVYLLPRDGFFKVAMVFGPKAFEQVLTSDITTSIKNELSAAKAYAEGRGIRIDIRDETLLNDIKKLITIKIAY